ncbi:MAG TPA: alanine dehydrogenase, partial [Rhodospirillales bacterium]|nr:alanine dehydrogenase [Rhodospirillales bacterium]
MQIGVPRETKAQEGRVALLPDHVAELVAAGHGVMVETGAGALSGASDDDYAAAGAKIAARAAQVFGECELIVKVKQPLAPEYGLLRCDHILFTNIHSASDKALTDHLLKTGLTGISAEDTHQFGSPNCPLAGEVGAFEGVRLCLSPHGGSGRHFMPHFGAPALRAVVLGLGAVGNGALRTLLRLGCSVTGLDINPRSRSQADLDWAGFDYVSADIDALPDLLADTDMFVNCVMWPKHRDDHLIDRAMLAAMKSSAVIVDISCDEGGAVETTRATSWHDPVYTEGGIRHFCVDNIPGAVPVTASAGYGKALLPFVKLIADVGVIEACRQQDWLARGLTCVDGTLILEETGRVQQRPFT